MCGILGVVCSTNRLKRNDIERGLESLHHRGPDDSGLVLQQAEGVDIWLGHRRLAILDLSPEGAQPMASDAGERVIFNGEIYNYLELAKQFALRPKTESDTEVLLSGWSSYGEPFIRSMNGMFAAMKWDPRTGEVALIRDRMGKKPLYIYQSDSVWAVASEPKAFEAMGLPLTHDPDAMRLYDYMGYVPGQMSIYKEVSRLKAGHIGRFDIRKRAFSSAPFADPIAGHQNQFSGSFDDAVDEFLSIFDDAVSLRLRADVPVGLFLSGGIDSSLVACSLARLQSQASVFSVRVLSQEYDESEVAKETTERLGLPLTVLTLSQQDFDRQLAVFWRLLDEPIADVSMIAMLAMSERAREHVKVVLTGDGGDESFVGYPWAAYPEQYGEILGGLNSSPWLASLAQTGPSLQGIRWISQILGRNPDTAAQKAFFFGRLLAGDLEDSYDAFRAALQLDDQSLWGLAHELYPEYEWASLENRTCAEKLSALDLVTYMRDNVLVKVDRATMAYGLEARSPFLDHRIVEFAQSLPADFKYSKGQHKRVLRAALERRLPGAISDGKKRGFGVPLPPSIAYTGSNDFRRWQNYVSKEWRAVKGSSQELPSPHPNL